MGHIVEMTREMVGRIKQGDIPETAFLTLRTPCPKCGGTVHENYRKFQCENGDFFIWKVVSSREFAAEEIEDLLAKGSIGPLQGFRSRLGKPFAAVVRLSSEFRAEFDFGQANADAQEPVDFSGQAPLGPCPKCGARVFEQPMAYVCEHSVGPDRRCDFRSGRIILQRPVEREQMQKLLATGKTDLLHRFISKKGRPFSAFLVRGGEGNVGFEFAPRSAKPGAKKPEPRAEARKPAPAQPQKARAERGSRPASAPDPAPPVKAKSKSKSKSAARPKKAA